MNAQAGMRERAQAIRLAILEELAHTPRGYMQAHRALCATAALTVEPEPKDMELDAAFARLEADALIHCEVDALGVKRWCLTAIGRAALAGA